MHADEMDIDVSEGSSGRGWDLDDAAIPEAESQTSMNGGSTPSVVSAVQI